MSSTKGGPYNSSHLLMFFEDMLHRQTFVVLYWLGDAESDSWLGNQTLANVVSPEVALGLNHLLGNGFVDGSEGVVLIHEDEVLIGLIATHNLSAVEDVQ